MNEKIEILIAVSPMLIVTALTFGHLRAKVIKRPPACRNPEHHRG